jgi:hypothetical protein
VILFFEEAGAFLMLLVAFEEELVVLELDEFPFPISCFCFRYF